LVAAFVVTRVTARRPRLEQRLIGSPTLLVNHGQVLAPRLRRQRVSPADLAAACRQYGLAGPEDADLAVLEVDGSISIVPRARTAASPPDPPRSPSRRRRRAGASAGLDRPGERRRARRRGRGRAGRSPTSPGGSGPEQRPHAGPDLQRGADLPGDPDPPADEPSGPPGT